MSGPDLPDPEPIPEVESDTATRAAQVVRRRRARGGRAQTILTNVELTGNITVIGHTDSIPVQASDPFGSNQRLSEARAAAIAELLVQGGVAVDVVSSEGHAAEEPVGDNGTKAGRAQNRRVVIKIQKRL